MLGGASSCYGDWSSEEGSFFNKNKKKNDTPALQISFGEYEVFLPFFHKNHAEIRSGVSAPPCKWGGELMRLFCGNRPFF